MKRSDAKPVVVLGMHRSGTSFLAGLLSQHGVDMGKELLESKLGNPYGHFEDVEILKFHQKRLQAAKPKETEMIFDDGTLSVRNFEFNPTKEDYDEAEAIIGRKSQSSLWGWKEPRTCLFLNFWKTLLPDMRGIILLRHPLEIYFSYLRRGIDYDILITPVSFMGACREYLEHLLQAYRLSSEKFVILRTSIFRVPDQLSSVMDKYLCIKCSEKDIQKLYYEEDFHSLNILDEHIMPFKFLFAELSECYEELRNEEKGIEEGVLMDARKPVEEKRHDRTFSNIEELSNLSQSIGFHLLEGWIAASNGIEIENYKNALHQRLNSHIKDFVVLAEGYRKQDAELKRCWDEVERVGTLYENKNESYKKLWAEHEKLGKGWEELAAKFTASWEENKRLHKEKEMLKADLQRQSQSK